MSSGVNQVILVGHLGSDPELKSTPTGRQVAEFRMATSRKWNDAQGQLKEATEWHRVKVYGRAAELAATYLKRGRQIYIEGKLKTEGWTDRSGKAFSWVVVEANQILMLDRPRDHSPDGESPEHADMSWLEFEIPHRAEKGGVSDAEIPF